MHMRAALGALGMSPLLLSGQLAAQAAPTQPQDRTFLLQTPPPPFHVDVRIDPTFVPREIDPRDPDTRELGAQVGYSFSPAANVDPALRGCAAGLRGSGR